MNIAAWASKDGDDRNGSSLLKTDTQDQPNTTVTEARAAAWEDAEKAKFLARFKREEIKIEAWENHQQAETEAEMRKIEGKAVFMKIRGVSDVEVEYKEIVAACEQAKQVNRSCNNLAKAASIPPLVIGILLQIFLQFTGINTIIFYATVLFQTRGFKANSSLLSSVIGRRKLLLQACC